MEVCPILSLKYSVSRIPLALFLIERHTRAYGRLKKISRRINDQARNFVIHELSGLDPDEVAPGY